MMPVHVCNSCENVFSMFFFSDLHHYVVHIFDVKQPCQIVSAKQVHE